MADVVDTWSYGDQNTKDWLHDGDVERSAADIIDTAENVAALGEQITAAAAQAVQDVNAAGSEQMAAIEGVTASQVAIVEAAGTAQAAAVAAEGASQIAAVADEAAGQVAAVQSAGSTQTAAVQSAGAAQISAVEAEGTAQITSIQAEGAAQIADAAAARDAAIGAKDEALAAKADAEAAAGHAAESESSALGSANAAAASAAGASSSAVSADTDAQAAAVSATAAASAQAAAETAQGKAEDAQDAAEAAAASVTASASQIAQNASDIATLQTAVAGKADSADIPVASDAVPQGLGTADAGTSAEYSRADHVHELPAQIAANTTAIAQNASAITALETKTDITNKNVANIQALLNGTLYREETDSTAAYSKAVPTGALPYATINEIGGKTVVWNQLVQNGDFSDGTTGWGKGGGVSSFSVANNVATLVFATGQFYNHYIGKSGVSMTNGHKYYVTGTFQSSSITQAFIQTSRNSQLVNVTGTKPVGKISSIFNNSQDTGNTNIFFRFADATLSEEGTGTLSDCYLIDLTLMFGAGNEPSSVAEFEAMFPSIDPAYNAGELMSAGVTEVVSEGRNLWNLSERTVGNLGDWLNTNKRTFSENEFYFALSGNNYYSHNVGTFTLTEDGFSYDSHTAYYGVALPIKVVPGETYYLTDNYTTTDGISILASFFSEDGTYISYKEFLNTSVTVPSGARWLIVIFAGTLATTKFTVSNIQLERGSTATEYTPYRAPVSLPIPSAVQALPGYGWSAGTAYNVVSLAQGKNTQKVGGIDLGSLDYTYQEASTRFYAIAPSIIQNPAANSNVPNLLCAKYVTNSYNNFANLMLDKTITLTSTGSLFIRDTSYTDAASFKTAMSGVMLYYELATPIETDISSLLTDSTIEVEAGGTLTFKNQHGDDWRVPVPNSETFLVQATPELPTTDGTYTLQCTVTDGTPSVTWVTA